LNVEKMVEALLRLPPLAPQVVGLIEDRRDPPLLGEGRKGDF